MKKSDGLTRRTKKYWEIQIRLCTKHNNNGFS